MKKIIYSVTLLILLFDPLGVPSIFRSLGIPALIIYGLCAFFGGVKRV